MRTARRYIKVCLCSLILIIALIAPATTGTNKGASGSNLLRNQIDDSSLLPQWNDAIFDSIANARDAQENSLNRAIWDLNYGQGGADDADTQTRSMADTLADSLGQDSASGYNKLTEMARNGYADLGTRVVGGQAVAGADDVQPIIATAEPKWENYPGPIRNDSSRDDNAYTVIPPPQPPVDGGNNNGGGGDGGDIPDNPVVPAPAALVLAAFGAVLVKTFKNVFTVK